MRPQSILSIGVLALLLGAANAAEKGLAGKYTDPTYFTKIPFGSHSHWLQPWRAYLETAPAHRFLDGVGINLHLHDANPDLILQMLAKNGVRNGRIEIGWGSINFDDGSKIDNEKRLRATLEACRKWDVRPTILLNSHHGVPCPVRFFDRKAAADAPAGATQVQLDNARDLVVGRSGLCRLTDYWAAEAIVTAIEGNRITLSKPLPKPINAGDKVSMATLKYRPFSVPGSEDYCETMAGWLQYVATVSAFVTDALGTRGAADQGFDLEVWNELTFGTHFLYIGDYYQPNPYEYDKNSIWKNLANATAEFVEKHPGDFRGVRLTNGFGNTIPWPAAGEQPKRITAINKHPYAGRKQFPQDDNKGVRLDAFGRKTGYVPTYSSLFPEYYGTAIQTETMVRDMGPLTSRIGQAEHGRYARGLDDPVTVWITEVGFAPNENGVTDRAEALRLKAKTTARYLAFYLNKGVEKLQLFGAMEKDLWLGIVLDEFGEYAKKNAAYPADDAPYTSPSLLVMRRMTETMRDGLDPKLTDVRQISVESITDAHDHSQFAGDGAAAHPPLYNREVLAILPYQVNARKFVIAYYVMTRDVMKDLPPEQYTVTLSGVKAAAKVRAYDPIRDRDVPVKVNRRGEQTLELGLTAADYPYLLVVEE